MDLYIVSKSDRDDMVKVGKSNDVNARCKQLQTAQPFRVKPCVVYHGMGHVETEVHQALEEYRVKDGPSREWFACSLPVAIRIVNDVLYPLDQELHRPKARDLPTAELVRAWVEGNTIPATHDEASCEADVKAAICDAFKLDPHELMEIIGPVGLASRRQRRRLIAYQYPGETRSRYVKLTMQ